MQPNNNNLPQEPQSPQPGYPPQPAQPQYQSQVPPQPASPPQAWAQPNFYGNVAPAQPPSSSMGSQPPLPPPPTPAASSGPVALTLPIWLGEHKKPLLAGFFGVLLLIVIGLQMVYPSSRLLPNTKIDGMSVGWMQKKEAAAKLDEAYGKLKLAIYFGETQAAFQDPMFEEVGIGVDNTERVNALTYPWYLRIIPSSFFWANQLSKPGVMNYVYDKSKIDSYTQEKVGDDCTIAPKDASLKLTGDKLQLIPSVPGGTCDITRFQQVLAETKPVAGIKNTVKIDMKETAALVDNDKAQNLGDTLNDRLAVPMPVKVSGADQTVEGREVLSWLDFKSFIPETPDGQQPDPDRIRDGSRLTFVVNKDRMLKSTAKTIAAKMTVEPGVTKISTNDFTETSHVKGQPGSGLDADKTAVAVENYINKKANHVVAEATVIQPKIVYSRTYSATNTGFAALFAQWPQEHPGTYAISMEEITGVQPYRKADYNGNVPMKSLGIEGGYVGYAVLMGLADKSILQVDEIADGSQVDECFVAMIEKTDLKCSEGFMKKIGHETLVRRGNEIGLKNTIFALSETKTSANDLVNSLLVPLFRSKIAQNAGGGRILAAMVNNRMSDAIPAGIPKGQVSNIAGEGETVHNDAALIYSPKGVYALAIMSEGASRADIAELTKKVEALHSTQPPKAKK